MADVVIGGSPSFQAGDKAQVRVTMGDRNHDGKVDATVEGYAAIPFLNGGQPMRVISITQNVDPGSLAALVGGVLHTVESLSSGPASVLMGQLHAKR
jgi:hypothetical protein